MKKRSYNILLAVLGCLFGTELCMAVITVNDATAVFIPGMVQLKNVKAYDGVQLKSDELLFDFASGENGYILFDVIPSVTGSYCFEAVVATGTGVSRYCTLGPLDAQGKFVAGVTKQEVPAGDHGSDWTQNIVTLKWNYDLNAGQTTTIKVMYDKNGQQYGINLYALKVTTNADADYHVMYYNEAYTTADANYTLFMKQPYTEEDIVTLPTSVPNAPEGMMFAGWVTADGNPFAGGGKAANMHIYPTWVETVWNIPATQNLPVGFIRKWVKCVPKGAQLIDSSSDGAYIYFDVCADETGYYQFTSSIGTKLENIRCALGYINEKDNFVIADTLDIANNNSWDVGQDYQWLFHLEGGKKYRFKMLCFSKGGYCLNAYNLRVEKFVPNTSLSYIMIDGMRFYSHNGAYNIDLPMGEKHSLKAMTSSTLAKVTYKAACETAMVSIKNNVIDCSSLKKGDVVQLTVTVTDGSESANYLILLNASDMMYREMRGLTTANGSWANPYNIDMVQEWTDNVFTLTPAKGSGRFSNGYWTPTGSKMIYGFCTENATVTLNVPNAYEVHEVSFIGHVFYNKQVNFTVSSFGATVTPTQASLPTTATEAYMGNASFKLDGHKAGTPITFSVSDNITNMYVRVKYRSIGDDKCPVLVNKNITEGSVLPTPNGCVSLRFNEIIRWTDGAKAILDGKHVEPKIEDNIFVNCYFWGMDYNSEHSFTLPAGSVEDESGNKLAQDITVNFFIGLRPIVKKKVFDFVVGIDGTIDQAITAANKAPGTDRFHIFVPDGNYELSGNDGDHMTSITRSNVSITGQSMDGSILCNTPESYGISNTATLHLKYTKNIYMQDITLRNNRGADKTKGPKAGQQVALYDRGQQSILHHVKLESFQDTYVSGHRAYFSQCDIYGGTDYICGGGDVFFTECNLYCRTSGNVIVAPATDANQKWGYVFQNCTIHGKNYTLGRPWQGIPRTYFLNTKMETAPTGTGWRDMSSLETHFYEYNSMDLNGNKLDLSKRGNSPTSTNKYIPVLTDEQAKEFTMYNVLGGTDGWVPTFYTEQTKKPVVEVAEGVATWILADDAMCMVIFLDGKYVTSTTANSYKLESEGEYTFCMANEMGGLGEIETYNTTDGMNSSGIKAITALVSNSRITLNGLVTDSIIEHYTATGSLIRQMFTKEETASFFLVSGMNIVCVIADDKTQVLKINNK